MGTLFENAEQSKSRFITRKVTVLLRPLLTTQPFNAPIAALIWFYIILGHPFENVFRMEPKICEKAMSEKIRPLLSTVEWIYGALATAQQRWEQAPLADPQLV